FGVSPIAGSGAVAIWSARTVRVSVRVHSSARASPADAARLASVIRRSLLESPVPRVPAAQPSWPRARALGRLDDTACPQLSQPSVAEAEVSRIDVRCVKSCRPTRNLQPRWGAGHPPGGRGQRERAVDGVVETCEASPVPPVVLGHCLRRTVDGAED